AAHAAVSSTEVAFRQVAETIADTQLATLPGDSLIYIQLLYLLEADIVLAVISRTAEEVEGEFVIAPQPLQRETAQRTRNRAKRGATQSVGDVGIRRLTQVHTRLQIAQRGRMRLQSGLINPRNGRILAYRRWRIVLPEGRSRRRLGLLGSVRRRSRGLRTAAVLCSRRAQRKG